MYVCMYVKIVRRVANKSATSWQLPCLRGNVFNGFLGISGLSHNVYMQLNNCLANCSLVARFGADQIIRADNDEFYFNS